MLIQYINVAMTSIRRARVLLLSLAIIGAVLMSGPAPGAAADAGGGWWTGDDATALALLGLSGQNGAAGGGATLVRDCRPKEGCVPCKKDCDPPCKKNVQGQSICCMKQMKDCWTIP